MGAVGGQGGGPGAGFGGGAGGAAGNHGSQGGRGHRPRRAGAGQGAHVGRAGQQVAGPQAGQAPGFGQAAHHDQAGHLAVRGQALRFAGHAVGERLVDHQRAAGAGQGAHGFRRMQDRGGVGGVAEDDEVGGFGDGPRVEAEVGAEDELVDLVAGRPEGGFGLGELGVDDDGVAGVEGPGDEREGLGGAGGDQGLSRRPGVAAGHGRGGGGGVRVSGEVVGGRADHLAQPGRRGAGADVHGQVDQTLGQFAVAVEAEVKTHGAPWAWSCGWSCGCWDAPTRSAKPGSAIRYMQVSQFIRMSPASASR